MDYEKKYNEALERAKKVLLDKETTNHNVAEFIFPELRESEDERIRKAIDEILKLDKSWKVAEKHGLTAGDIRVWLKKQKEPKQTDLPAGFYFIDLDGNKYYSKEFRYGDMKLKVGEQKPVEGKEYSSPECGTTAWSEEDEEMLKYVIGDVNDAKQLFSTKEAIDLCDKEIAWLKSLPMRCPKSSDNWKPSDHQMNIKVLEA